MLRCPICGKKPRIRRTFKGQTIIACKPLFQKAHISSEISRIKIINLGNDVVCVWNKAVCDYISNMDKTNHIVRVECNEIARGVNEKRLII